MSLGSQFPSSVPEDVERLAKKLYKKKANVYVKMGDTLGKLLTESDFQEVYSKRGKGGNNPIVMTLITLVQYAENLSDEEVMDAIVGRIDLKYLLRLPLEHLSFDSSCLTEFRERLIAGGLDLLLFERVLQFSKEKGLLKTEKQRTDSTHVLAAVRLMSRIELILEGVRKALDSLSKTAPNFVLGILKDLLHKQAYIERGMNFRIPKNEQAKKELAEAIARDGQFILDEIDRDENLKHLKKMRSIVLLRRILGEQFDIDDSGRPLLKRKEDLAKSHHLLGSPHDPEARYSTKKDNTWLGFKLHTTETYDVKLPSLITDVQVTKSTVSDSSMLLKIHRSLHRRDLAPKEHLVDAGYTKIETIKKARDSMNIFVIGPLRGGNNWQTQENKGFGLADFAIDWAKRIAVCPANELSKTWRERDDRNIVEVVFPSEKCLACPFRQNCTKSVASGRTLELKPKPISDFLQEYRSKSDKPEYWRKYQQRSGIEGTISRIARAFSMRRNRYIGIRKLELQARIAATVTNVFRIAEYLLGGKGSKTRQNAFEKLLLANPTAA